MPIERGRRPRARSVQPHNPRTCSRSTRVDFCVVSQNRTIGGPRVSSLGQRWVGNPESWWGLINRWSSSFGSDRVMLHSTGPIPDRSNRSYNYQNESRETKLHTRIKSGRVEPPISEGRQQLPLLLPSFALPKRFWNFQHVVQDNELLSPQPLR